VQRHLGLHGKRLLRLSFDSASSALTARDHYLARLVGLFDLLGAAYRLAR
jgi:hypothetical protein